LNCIIAIKIEPPSWYSNPASSVTAAQAMTSELNAYSEQFASLLAAIGSLLSVILVLVFIPHVPKQNTKPAVKASDKAADTAESVFNLGSILRNANSAGNFSDKVCTNFHPKTYCLHIFPCMYVGRFDFKLFKIGFQSINYS
jgi:hypothetical protein